MHGGASGRGDDIRTGPGASKFCDAGFLLLHKSKQADFAPIGALSVCTCERDRVRIERLILFDVEISQLRLIVFLTVSDREQYNCVLHGNFEVAIFCCLSNSNRSSLCLCS